jgi:uncharacterized protein YxeA
MLNFAEKHYRTCVEVILWLNLVSCVIAGWNIAGTFGMTCSRYSNCSSSDGYSILGAIVGLAVGLGANILIGGFIAKILNIDANVEIIKNKAKNSSSDAATTSLDTSTNATTNTSLASPKSVWATINSSNGITVRWEAVSGATGYFIYRSQYEFGTYNRIGNVSGNSYENTGLSASTKYFYRVSAFNNDGEGKQSSPVSAETL